MKAITLQSQKYHDYKTVSNYLPRISAQRLGANRRANYRQLYPRNQCQLYEAFWSHTKSSFKKNNRTLFFNIHRLTSRLFILPFKVLSFHIHTLFAAVFAFHKAKLETFDEFVLMSSMA